MKIKKNPKPVFLLLALALFLAACSKTSDEPEVDAVAQVYTSVAETLAAQPTKTMPATATLVPTATASLISTAPALATQAYPTTTMPVATAVPCHDAIYMVDISVPDNTVFAPGASFVKTWQLFNGGSCAWEATYALSFSSGEEMSGIPTALGVQVPANGQAQLSVSMTAPLTAGSYTGYWQLTDDTGKKFGNAIFVKIVVADASATPTSAPTAIPTETLIPTATP